MNDTAAAFLPTGYERLAPEERRQLAFGDLARSAGEVADAVLLVASASIATRHRLAEAQTRVLLAGDADDPTPAKCDVIRERAVLASLGDRSRALRQLSSILQSLLKAGSL